MVSQEVGRGRVFISDEGALGRHFDGYAGAESRLRTLSGALRSFDTPTNHSVILYFRPQFAWVPSCYAQRVRVAAVPSGSEYVRQRLEDARISWFTLLQSLRLASPLKVVFRNTCEHQDVVEDFRTLFRLSRDGDASNMARVNASPDPVVVEALRQLPHTLSTYRLIEDSLKAIWSKVSDDFPRFSLFLEREQAALQEIWSVDLKKFQDSLDEWNNNLLIQSCPDCLSGVCSEPLPSVTSALGQRAVGLVLREYQRLC